MSLGENKKFLKIPYDNFNVCITSESDSKAHFVFLDYLAWYMYMCVCVCFIES